MTKDDECVELTGRKKAKAEGEGEGNVAWPSTTVLRLWKAASLTTRPQVSVFHLLPARLPF